MRLFRRYASLIIATLFNISCFAQSDTINSSDDNFMYQNGKIYVVVAVVTVIVIGLLIYVISLDRKISKLEKKE